MAIRRDGAAQEQHGTPGLTVVPDDRRYLLLTDEQLRIERDRLREQLDELTNTRKSSRADCQLLVDIEREVEQIMDELLQRARSRHPSSAGLSARPRFRTALQRRE